ncbi:MAG: alpha/beta fold hydrolase [Pseudomonadales bacterium]
MRIKDSGLDRYKTQRNLQLTGGRSIAWYEWGEATGTPLIFCTGAAMSGCMGFGANAIRELGVRLISIDRPGLGQSTNDPEKTFASWAEDVREILVAENLLGTEVGAVGFSQGGPFALALAAAGIVNAVALVSAQDELGHPSVRSAVAGEVVAMLDAVNDDPDQFEEHFRSFATADGLWDLIVSMSHPHDRKYYEEPTFAAAYQQALTSGFSQGPQGYVRDLVIAMAPWPFLIDDLLTPIDLWYGGLDTSTVHSPDHGESLASRIRHSRRVLRPDEGGSLLWTNAREILAGVLRSM